MPRPSWRDVDWGLTALLTIIMVLSFGAYRVLDHFRLYSSSQRSAAIQAQGHQAEVLERSAGTTKALKAKHQAAAAAAAAAASTSGSKAEASTPSSSQELAEQAGSSAGNAQQQEQQEAPAASSSGTPLGSSLQGAPGLPQPSPLDAGFSRPEVPWIGRDLGSLALQPLQPDGTLQLPSLTPLQVDQPAHAVSPAEAADMPRDPSIPSMRERASMAMRASSAAVEAAQRASAFSAAASSAASRAAEAAERATAASAAVQGALESAAEEAMAAAVARMNKAVEMVADAESRAASAAALATAHQDIAEGQATVAQAAADVPAVPQHKQAAHAGSVHTDRRLAIHAQMFDVWGIVRDWAVGVADGASGALQRLAAWVAALVASVVPPVPQ